METRGFKSEAQLPATARPINGDCGCERRRHDLSENKMEMTMRKKILIALLIPLIAALTAQATAASEYRHTRTKDRAVASEHVRNSNAYAAPDDITVQSGWSSYANGAMASGIAGH
jgi:hypothetical protein